MTMKSICAGDGGSNEGFGPGNNVWHMDLSLTEEELTHDAWRHGIRCGTCKYWGGISDRASEFSCGKCLLPQKEEVADSTDKKTTFEFDWCAYWESNQK